MHFKAHVDTHKQSHQNWYLKWQVKGCVRDAFIVVIKLSFPLSCWHSTGREWPQAFFSEGQRPVLRAKLQTYYSYTYEQYICENGTNFPSRSPWDRWRRPNSLVMSATHDNESGVHCWVGSTLGWLTDMLSWTQKKSKHDEVTPDCLFPWTNL